MTRIAIEPAETKAVTPITLGSWCETCGAVGPSVDVTGLSAQTAMKRIKAQLKPWITTHGAIMYITTVGAQVRYHQPRFGPVGG